MQKIKHPSEALLVFGIFLGLSYLTPFHIHPYRNFVNDALAILGVILGIGTWAWFSKEALRVPGAVILPLGLIIVIGLQTLNGFILYPTESFFAILYLSCFIVALIFGSSLLIGNDDLKEVSFALACIFVTTSIISVFFQHVQLINLNWYPYIMPLTHDQNPRPFANIAQPNLLALLHCFSLASVWWLYLIRKLTPWLAIASAVVILLGVVLTESRVAWLIVPLFFVLCWHHPKDHAKVAKPVLLMLLLTFVAMVVFLPGIWSSLGFPMDSSEHRAGQTGVRIVLWQQAWLMSLLHPWFGVGWYQFGEQQVILSSLFKPSEYNNYAHNIVLGFAAEIGWPLTVLIFVAVMYWFYVCCIKRWENIEVRFLSLLLLAIFIHSLVEFPLWDGFILMPFGVIVGALHREKLGWKYSGIKREWMVGFCLCSVLTLGALSWDFYRIAYAFSVLADNPTNDQSLSEKLKRPAFTLFPQFYDYFRILDIKIVPGMPKQDIQLLEKITLRFPHFVALQNLALAYAYSQRPSEALKVLKTLHSLQGRYYPQTYELWSNYSKQQPSNFLGIFDRMPKPSIDIYLEYTEGENGL